MRVEMLLLLLLLLPPEKFLRQVPRHDRRFCDEIFRRRRLAETVFAVRRPGFGGILV
jgi:hypothetical protein